MPDWLRESLTLDPAVSPATMGVRIAAALALGGLVAIAYRLSHGEKARDTWTLATTIVLLAGLLAMISMVIGESVARAFGLVGALSIVRFRTVVEDTRDTAFVIFAVIVGMAVGTGLLLIAAVGVPLIGGVAIVLSRVESRGGTPENAERATLKVRLAIGHDPASLTPVIQSAAQVTRCAAVRTVRQGSAMELTYRVSVTGEAGASLVRALSAVAGVQEAELSVVDQTDDD